VASFVKKAEGTVCYVKEGGNFSPVAVGGRSDGPFPQKETKGREEGRVRPPDGRETDDYVPGGKKASVFGGTTRGGGGGGSTSSVLMSRIEKPFYTPQNLQGQGERNHGGGPGKENAQQEKKRGGGGFHH